MVFSAPEHLGPQLHDSKAGGRKELKSCSFTSMAVDSGLSWEPHCFSTSASLYGPSLWTSLGFLASWCMACPRASIPKEREPDGSCFAFYHQTSCPLYSICEHSHKSPPSFKEREYRPHLSREESKIHIVRKACGMKNLRCGHLEKYNPPHLSNRIKSSH